MWRLDIFKGSCREYIYIYRGYTGFRDIIPPIVQDHMKQQMEHDLDIVGFSLESAGCRFLSAYGLQG